MPKLANRTRRKSTTDRILILLHQALRATSRLAPRASVLLAERLFLTPIRSRPPARESAWQETARRVQVGPLAAWVWGTGPRTVLLVHGWAGRGGQLGAFIEPLVKHGFRVVAYDGPGHGRSAGRRSSLPELRAAISTMARAFAPVESVIAHSLGATATLWALARGELLASRVVLLAPPARLEEILSRFSAMTGFSPAVLTRMRRRIEARFGFRWSDAEPLRLAAGLSVPALVIHDRDDREIPLAEGRDLAAAWPGARLLTTGGLGHRRLLGNPEVISAAVAFLSADPPAASEQAGRTPVSAGYGLAAVFRSRRLMAAQSNKLPAETIRFRPEDGTEENMTSIPTRIHRLVLELARLATRGLALPLESWDLELEQREIDRQLAFGRD